MSIEISIEQFYIQCQDNNVLDALFHIAGGGTDAPTAEAGR